MLALGFRAPTMADGCGRANGTTQPKKTDQGAAGQCFYRHDLRRHRRLHQAASIWTASRSARSTASTRARTCSSSIPASASTAACASPNAPPRRSCPIPRTGWSKWLELNKTFSAQWPNITRKRDAPADADEHGRAKRASSTNILGGARPGRLIGGPGSAKSSRRASASAFEKLAGSRNINVPRG
jgi:hypothetical protein